MRSVHLRSLIRMSCVSSNFVFSSLFVCAVCETYFFFFFSSWGSVLVLMSDDVCMQFFSAVSPSLGCFFFWPPVFLLYFIFLSLKIIPFCVVSSLDCLGMTFPQTIIKVVVTGCKSLCLFLWLGSGWWEGRPCLEWGSIYFSNSTAATTFRV